MTTWRSETETASTPASSVDSVGTTDLSQFRALGTVYTYSLCLMVTRILMDSSPFSRRAQPAAPPPACMMGLVSWTLLTLTTVPVWLATQAGGVKMWWDAAGLRCPPMELRRDCFTILVHASLSIAILGLSCGDFALPSASVMAPGALLLRNVCQWKESALYLPSQHTGTTSWFMGPTMSSSLCSTCATSPMK